MTTGSSSSSVADPTNLGAAAFIQDEAGRILLVRENYGAHRWGLPGGAVEVDESPWGAVAREVLEETGIGFVPEEIIAAYFLLAPPGVRFVFRGRVDHRDVVLPDTGELSDYGWFEPESLPSPMTDTAPAAIAHAIDGVIGAFSDVERG